MIMTATSPSLMTFYRGWETYEGLLATAIAPLSLEQLELRAAPNLRSIRELATHIIAVRARWFHGLMGEGGDEMDTIGNWDRPGQPTRTGAELAQGLEATWQLIQKCLARWTPADLEHVFAGTWGGEEY